MENINQTSSDHQNRGFAELLTATPTTELASIISVFYQIDMTTQRLLELGAQHPDRPLTETASTDVELNLEERATWMAGTLLTLPSAQPATLGVFSIIAQWAATMILDHLDDDAYVQLRTLLATEHTDQKGSN